MLRTPLCGYVCLSHAKRDTAAKRTRTVAVTLKGNRERTEADKNSKVEVLKTGQRDTPLTVSTVLALILLSCCRGLSCCTSIVPNTFPLEFSFSFFQYVTSTRPSFNLAESKECDQQFISVLSRLKIDKEN